MSETDSTATATIAIQQVLYRYCRSMDRMDAGLALACFDPAATLSYGALYQGDPAGFVAWLWPVHAAMVGHTHTLGNVIVDVTGADTAVSESYVMVTLRFEDRNTDDADAATQQFDLVGKGRYLDRWSCGNDGTWRIVARTYVSDLGTVIPVAGHDLSNVLRPTAPHFRGQGRDARPPRSVVPAVPLSGVQDAARTPGLRTVTSATTAVWHASRQLSLSPCIENEIDCSCCCSKSLGGATRSRSSITYITQVRQSPIP